MRPIQIYFKSYTRDVKGCEVNTDVVYLQVIAKNMWGRGGEGVPPAIRSTRAIPPKSVPDIAAPTIIKQDKTMENTFFINTKLQSKIEVIL